MNTTTTPTRDLRRGQTVWLEAAEHEATIAAIFTRPGGVRDVLFTTGDTQYDVPDDLEWEVITT